MYVCVDSNGMDIIERCPRTFEETSMHILGLEINFIKETMKMEISQSE